MRMKGRTFSFTKLLKIGWVPLCLFLMACHMDMYYQPKATTYDKSVVFANGAQAQPLPPNTVSRGQNLDTAFTTGTENGQPIATNPVQADETVLARGKDRYEVFCTPCHGALGNGKGAVAAILTNSSGVAPASFYLDRLRTSPDGYYFQVITNGVVRNGAQYMYPYASRISPEDRWAIIAYIRDLQENPPAEVKPEELQPTEAPAPGSDKPTPIPFNTPTAPGS